MLKRLGIYCLAVLLVASIAGCGSSNKQAAQPEAKKIVMKFAHTNTPSPQDPYHAYAEKFKELVEKGSNGRIEVQIFPGGQMGGEQRAFQDAQNNILQATVVAVNNASVFSASLGAFDLPYMFTSLDDFNKVISSCRDKINERLMAEAQVRAISWTQQGFRVISNSKKPVEKVADLQGLKIRVPENPLQIAAFKSWGCEPVPIGVSELFSALQQKVVDGQENPYVSLYTNKWFEVQKYVTEIHYKLWIGPVVVNEKWFQGLPKDLQEVIIKAGLETEKYCNDLAVKQETEAKAKLQEKGLILSGTPKDEAVWKEKAMTVWPQFYSKIGDPSILESFLKVLNRSKP